MFFAETGGHPQGTLQARLEFYEAKVLMEANRILALLNLEGWLMHG
jgi:hypothetical protein